MKLKYGDPISVTWIDACGHNGWKEAIDDGVRVTSVGLFIKRNKNGLCIAQSIDEEDESLVLCPGFVPSGMIRKIRKLR